MLVWQGGFEDLRTSIGRTENRYFVVQDVVQLKPISRGSPIAIMWLEQLARTPVADCRLCLRFGASLRRPSLALESDEYLRSCLDPGQIDLWAVSVCTRGDRRGISGRVQSTGLLGGEVQEEEGRRRSRTTSGVRQQPSRTGVDGHSDSHRRGFVHGDSASDRRSAEDHTT